MNKYRLLKYSKLFHVEHFYITPIFCRIGWLAAERARLSFQSSASLHCDAKRLPVLRAC